MENHHDNSLPSWNHLILLECFKESRGFEFQSSKVRNPNRSHYELRSINGMNGCELSSWWMGSSKDLLSRVSYFPTSFFDPMELQILWIGFIIWVLPIWKFQIFSKETASWLFEHRSVFELLVTRIWYLCEKFQDWTMFDEHLQNLQQRFFISNHFGEKNLFFEGVWGSNSSNLWQRVSIMQPMALNLIHINFSNSRSLSWMCKHFPAPSAVLYQANFVFFQIFSFFVRVLISLFHFR